MEAQTRAGEGAAVGDAPQQEQKRIAVAQLPGTQGPFGWCNLVKGRHGHFLTNPLDIYVGRSLLIYGEYSEGEVDLFRKLLKAGDTVVEVGANMGAHTVPLARLVGETGAVFALEPQRLVYLQLCANLALNGIPNTKPFLVAAGDKAGVVSVPILHPYREHNFGALELGGQPQEGEAVGVVVLDDWQLSGVSLIKIDVEGMEAPVLRGAVETIRRNKPWLYLEADRDKNMPEIAAALTDCGYRWWWHFPPLYSKQNFARQEIDVFSGVISINVLAVHEERAELAEKLLPGMEAKPEENWRAAYKRLTVAGASIH